MKPPSLFPLFDFEDLSLSDGLTVKVPAFCHRARRKGTMCADHYTGALKRGEGYSQCPLGFTTRTYSFDGKGYAISCVVAHPRFGTEAERLRAKEHPEVRTSREAIESVVALAKAADEARAEAIQSAAKVLPQAFHELRKLNGAILQHAEKELKVSAGPALMTIKSAAELMRNNFDILEALSNIEGMKALPLDATINFYDLTYKTKKVLDERAASRGLQIQVGGVRALVPGSRKSLPIVPAVLIENAIKYSRRDTVIHVDVGVSGQRATLTVENETDYNIDSVSCFERGTRYAGGAVEGGGFGLFLAREIVLAHSGHIRCEPGANRVRFIADLPLVRVIPASW